MKRRGARARLVRVLSFETDFFVGVLTKPDRIPQGEEGNWLRFIKGEAEHLANGWFAVKQPATADLRQGVTWEEAREQENLFFSTATPWSTERDYRHRFGTRNLTGSLSDILSDLIRRRLVSLWNVRFYHGSFFFVSYSSLPELDIELRNLLQETELQLSKLPGPPSEDAQSEVILLVSNFARELATYVEGTPDDNGIHQLIRPLNETFSTAIRGTAQPFSPFVREVVQPNPRARRVGVAFTHPEFPALGAEPEISNSDADAICVNEVMEMANR